MESTQDKWQLFKYKKHLDSLWDEYVSSTGNRDAMTQFENFISLVKNYKNAISSLWQKANDTQEEQKLMSEDILIKIPLESIFSHTGDFINHLVSRSHSYGVKVPEVLEIILFFLNIPKYAPKIIVKESLVKSIISILYKLQSSEINFSISLKILDIMCTGDENPDEVIKREFARNKGFRVLLKLKPSSLKNKNLIYKILNFWTDIRIEEEKQPELGEEEQKQILQSLSAEKAKRGERKNSDNFGLQLWKMAKGVTGIFGQNDEHKEEDDEEITIKSWGEIRSESFSSHKEHVIEDKLIPSYERINQSIGKLKYLEGGVSRSAIFELLKNDLKQVPTESLEKLNQNSLFIKYKNHQILDYYEKDAPVIDVDDFSSEDKINPQERKSLAPNEVPLSKDFSKNKISSESYFAKIISQGTTQLLLPKIQRGSLDAFKLLLNLISKSKLMHIDVIWGSNSTSESKDVTNSGYLVISGSLSQINIDEKLELLKSIILNDKEEIVNIEAFLSILVSFNNQNFGKLLDFVTEILENQTNCVYSWACNGFKLLQKVLLELIQWDKNIKEDEDTSEEKTEEFKEIEVDDDILVSILLRDLLICEPDMDQEVDRINENKSISSFDLISNLINLMTKISYTLNNHNSFESPIILSNILKDLWNETSNEIKDALLNSISNWVLDKNYRLKRMTYDIQDSSQIELCFHSLLKLYISLLPSLENPFADLLYCTILQSLYHLSFSVSLEPISVLSELNILIQTLTSPELCDTEKPKIIYLISQILKILWGLGNDLNTQTDLKQIPSPSELIKVWEILPMDNFGNTCFLSHFYAFWSLHKGMETLLEQKFSQTEWMKQEYELKPSDRVFLTVLQRFYLKSQPVSFYSFLKELFETYQIEGNHEEMIKDLEITSRKWQKAGEIFENEEIDIYDIYLQQEFDIDSDIIWRDMDWTEFHIEVLKVDQELACEFLNIGSDFQIFLLDFWENLQPENELYEPLVNLLFRNFEKKILKFPFEKFSKFFKAEAINWIFFNNVLEWLKNGTFSIKIDFPETPSTFPLTSFLGEGEALTQLANHVYEAGRFITFPSLKLGYSFIFSLKMKKLYERMMILTLVDDENKPLLELWYSAERYFLEYEKVKEYVKELSENPEGINEDMRGRSSYLQKINESPYEIKHSFIVKFLGHPPQRIECNDKNTLDIEGLNQIALVHNKYDLTLYLNGSKVGSIKPESFKDTPSRICFQAVDKTLSWISLFEGSLQEDQISRIYNYGENALPNLEKLPFIKSDKNLKLFWKFPWNLTNINFAQTHSKKLIIMPEATPKSKELSFEGSKINYIIEKYTEKDFYERENPEITQKSKRTFIENPYKDKTRY